MEGKRSDRSRPLPHFLLPSLPRAQVSRLLDLRVALAKMRWEEAEAKGVGCQLWPRNLCFLERGHQDPHPLPLAQFLHTEGSEKGIYLK